MTALQFLVTLSFCLFLTTNGFNVTEENFCFSSFPRWSVGNGNILLNGNNVFHIKGINWFGMETEALAPHGLNLYPLDHFLKLLRTHNFNVLRLPFSVINVLNNPTKSEISCKHNPELCNLRYLDIMDKLLEVLGNHGILVLLDQHRIYGSGDQAIHELWYEDSQFSEESVLESWEILLAKVGRRWNILGLDLKNEPHGVASWGSGKNSTDWNLASQRIIRHIVKKFPIFQGLFFIQGVQDHSTTVTPNNFPHFWGENLEGVHQHPIRTGYPQLDRRVVYSPHIYGPDVWMQAYFQSPDFPGVLQKVWNLHFGFIEKTTGHPVVIGEWGGQYWPGTKDKEWADALVQFMIKNCMSDNFYWCLNPNAFSTGGILLDDWKTVRTDKLLLLQTIQPNPSRLVPHRGMYCFFPGSPANPKCHDSSPKSPKSPYQQNPSMGIPVILPNSKESKQPVYVRPRPEPAPRTIPEPSVPKLIIEKPERPSQSIDIPKAVYQPRPKWIIPVVSHPKPETQPKPRVIIHTVAPANQTPRPPNKKVIIVNGPTRLEKVPRLPQPGPRQPSHPDPTKTKIINPISPPVEHKGLMVQTERVNVWETFWPETTPLSELKIILRNVGDARICDAEIGLGDAPVKGIAHKLRHACLGKVASLSSGGNFRWQGYGWLRCASRSVAIALPSEISSWALTSEASTPEALA